MPVGRCVVGSTCPCLNGPWSRCPRWARLVRMMVGSSSGASSAVVGFQVGVLFLREDIGLVGGVDLSVPWAGVVGASGESATFVVGGRSGAQKVGGGGLGADGWAVPSSRNVAEAGADLVRWSGVA